MSLVLEDFARPEPVPDGPPSDATPAIDEARLAGFDAGYAAGWEDATRAAEEEASEAGVALRAKLQDLSFTFQEARVDVMTALRPLLSAIVASAVPRLVHATLGNRIEEILGDMAEERTTMDALLRVAPGRAAEIETALAGAGRFPLTIVEDPTLAPGRLRLSCANAERDLDLTDLQSRLDAALDALDAAHEETRQHG